MFVVWISMLSGCALLSDRQHLIDLRPYPEKIHIDVPFYPQTDDLCGPAAMAMVMAWNGENVDLATLHKQIYTSGLGGSLQQDMLASARRHGLLAVSFDSVSALLAELSQGHPVILLLNLRLESWPQWHYVVVTGFDQQRESAFIHDGETAKREIPLSTLLQQWYRGKRWGLVVTRPDQLPASADDASLLKSIVGLERAAQNEAARIAYRAASERYPSQPLFWLGRGNSAFATGNAEEAITAFRKTLSLDETQGAAYHNLGLALLEQGKVEAALLVVSEGLALASGFQEALENLAKRLRESTTQAAP